jgi:predicted kinase
MKKLIIVRGISGAGKSYLTQQYIDCAINLGLTYKVCSADNYFIINGVCKFNKNDLYQAHLVCQTQALIAMRAGINIVIIDNTNIKKKDYKFYIEIASEYGFDYEVEEQVVEMKEEDIELCFHRNQHQVPLETIKRQFRQFEK